LPMSSSFFLRFQPFKVRSLFIASVEELGGWMVAFSAGAFLFLSASELIPEMLREDDRMRSVIQLAILVLGMLTIYSLGLLFPHE